MISLEKQILFLLSQVSVIEIRELIRIYEVRKYSPQHIRNTLSRLKKAGYIDSPGRSAYSITESGQLWLNVTNNKPLKYAAAWDNCWYIVMLEIPESQRKIRDMFRADLLGLGFGMLYNSVYIAPWDYTNEVLKLAAAYQVEKNITMLNGSFLTNEITPPKAWEIWRLAKVEELYLKQAQWFRQEFLPAYRAIPKDAQAVDFFVLFLELGEHLSELLINDPMLPKPILPEHWAGEAICTELGTVLKEIIALIPNNSYYSQFIINCK